MDERNRQRAAIKQATRHPAVPVSVSHIRASLLGLKTNSPTVTVTRGSLPALTYVPFARQEFQAAQRERQHELDEVGQLWAGALPRRFASSE